MWQRLNVAGRRSRSLQTWISFCLWFPNGAPPSLTCCCIVGMGGGACDGATAVGTFKVFREGQLRLQVHFAFRTGMDSRLCDHSVLDDVGLLVET